MNPPIDEEPSEPESSRVEMIATFGALIQLGRGSDADPDPSLAKKRARQQVAERRKGLPTVDHAAFCASVSAFLEANVAPSKRILIYDAMGDEVNLTALIEADPNPESRFAITRTPDQGFALTLHPWGARAERHRYGYLQPAKDAPIVADENIGAVLVPALVFDLGGMRLGRGKGYYDRLLARKGPDRIRIGMTAGLIADRVPRDSYDVAMTHVAAPAAVLPVRA